VRVLVVGHHRSATTWIGTALASTANSGFVSEPDDASWVPFAIRALERRGQFPVLAADQRGSRSLTRMWAAAFGSSVHRIRGQQRFSNALLRGTRDHDRLTMLAPGGRITPRLRLAGALAVPKHAAHGVEHRVVKSVLSPFMLEWIRARWDPTIVICFRHPLDVVASFIDVGLAPGTGRSLIERMSFESRAYASDVYGVPEPRDDRVAVCVAWRVGLVMSVLDDARAAHPRFHVVDHEVVSADPVGQLRALADAIGLEWTSRTEDFVVASDRPGTRFEITRVAGERRSRWRERLPPDDAVAAAAMLARFPIAARYAPDLSA
jgi:hypothetical protein